MKNITFYNNTELDPMAFRIMGMSVKEEGSFGKFGTGLKYAIAKIIALGDSIEIKTNGQRFFFAKVEKTFRGSPFDVITCNGEEMPYTTELGKFWEPWQAYRELYCNARDEGGGVTDSKVKGEQITEITVSGEAIASVYNERGRYFLEEGITPLWENETLQIIDRPSDGIYLNGIFIGGIAPSRFTWNFKKGITLSEDRLAMYSFMIPGKIGEQVRNCSVPRIAQSVISDHFADGGSLEGKMEFSGAGTPSDEFLSVCKTAFKRGRRIPWGMSDFAKHCQTEILENLEEFDEREEKMLRSASEFLRKAGYDVSRFAIQKIPSEGSDLFGTGEGGKINLTKRAFESGMFDLCLTLLEEYAHCDSGYEDFTREFQDWIFRAVLTQMEARTGEFI